MSDEQAHPVSSDDDFDSVERILTFVAMDETHDEDDEAYSECDEIKKKQSTTTPIICKEPGCEGRTFSRSDNLLQHLRGYHKKSSILDCTDPDCGRKGDDGFRGRDELKKHMHEAHGVQWIDCTEPKCDRIGFKGFPNRNAMLNHVRDIHRKSGTFECRYPSCDRKAGKNFRRKIDRNRHEKEVHEGIKRQS